MRYSSQLSSMMKAAVGYSVSSRQASGLDWWLFCFALVSALLARICPPATVRRAAAVADA